MRAFAKHLAKKYVMMVHGGHISVRQAKGFLHGYRTYVQSTNRLAEKDRKKVLEDVSDAERVVDKLKTK